MATKTGGMPDEISSGTPPVSLFSLAYSIK